MVGSGSFMDMAINNKFAFDDMADIRSMPLAGWKLKARLGDVFIYSKDGLYYISRHCSGTPAKEYDDTEIDKKRFVRENIKARDRMLQHKIIYEDFGCKTYLTSLFI